MENSEEMNGLTYLRMMTDVLQKKEVQLQKLTELTKEQEKLLKAEEFDDPAFLELIEKKEDHIKKILEFDSGFQAIYNRIEQELKNGKEKYKEQIIELQKLISRVTELGTNLQALERTNKTGMELRLSEKKKGIKQFKVSKQTADRYYKNMIGMKKDASYFMDQKQ